MLGELPNLIIAVSVCSTFLSLIITNKTMKNIAKLVILASSIFLIRFIFKGFLITEAGVSLVMILATLKLWELDSVEDYFNMFLILALFESCLFLLNPSFFVFLVGMIKILFFFYFILRIRQYDFSQINIKRIVLLIIPSLIFAVVLFYTFPRFTQGFISSVNIQTLFQNQNAQIDFKSLGPISPSSKVIFRATGDKLKNISSPMLYWRESILWDQAKDEWRTGSQNLKTVDPQLVNPTFDYNVFLLKEFNHHLPVLDGISRISVLSLPYNTFSDYSISLKSVYRSKIQYSVQSNLNVPLLNYSPLMEKKGLRITSSDLEFFRKSILQNHELNYYSDQEKLDLLIRYFKSRNFSYTLSPPLYKSIEDFIKSGNSGYCSHFAMAFTYLSRSIGLPARMVSGYQGGELNPYDQSLTIREYDGHIWVEVYLTKNGWKRIDPTAFVAPERIELGARLFSEKIDPFIDFYYYKIPRKYFSFKFLNNFSFWMDTVNMSAFVNILNFDKDTQQSFWKSILQLPISPGWIFVIALIISMMTFWFFYLFLSKPHMNRVEKRYRKFLLKMQAKGLVKYPYETANLFRRRCLEESEGLEDYINQETDSYIRFFYEC